MQKIKSLLLKRTKKNNVYSRKIFLLYYQITDRAASNLNVHLFSRVDSSSEQNCQVSHTKI